MLALFTRITRPSPDLPITSPRRGNESEPNHKEKDMPNVNTTQIADTKDIGEGSAALSDHRHGEENPLNTSFFRQIEEQTAKVIVRGLNAVHGNVPDSLREMDPTERVRALGADAFQSAKKALKNNPAFILGEMARESFDTASENVTKQVENIRDPQKSLGAQAHSLGQAATELGAGIMEAGQTALTLFQVGIDRHHRASLEAFAQGGTTMLEQMAKLSGIPKDQEQHGYHRNVSYARIKTNNILNKLFEKAHDRPITQNELTQASKEIGKVLTEASNDLHGKAVTQMFHRTRATITENRDFKNLTKEDAKLVMEPVSTKTLSRKNFEAARTAAKKAGEIGLGEQGVNRIHNLVAKGLKVHAFDMQAANEQAQAAKTESLNRLAVFTQSHKIMAIAEELGASDIHGTAKDQLDKMKSALEEGRSISTEDYRAMHTALKEAGEEMAKLRRAHLLNNLFKP